MHSRLIFLVHEEFVHQARSQPQFFLGQEYLLLGKEQILGAAAYVTMHIVKWQLLKCCLFGDKAAASRACCAPKESDLSPNSVTSIEVQIEGMEFAL